LTFAAGSTTQTITVLVNGDALAEPDETFFVNLSSPTDATLADGQGLGTIRNDDTPIAGFAPGSRTTLGVASQPIAAPASASSVVPTDARIAATVSNNGQSTARIGHAAIRSERPWGLSGPRIVALTDRVAFPTSQPNYLAALDEAISRFGDLINDESFRDPTHLLDDGLTSGRVGRRW
jgi:hypothetical protein